MDFAALAANGVRLHDTLEARGFSQVEIAGILGGGLVFSLRVMPPDQRVLCLRAHLAALADVGIDLGDHVRLVVRPAR